MRFMRSPCTSLDAVGWCAVANSLRWGWRARRLLYPACVDDGEFGAPGLFCELLIGESGRVGLGADADLEGAEVVAVEDLAGAHEGRGLAGGAVDGVHAEEVGLFVDADGVEAVVGVGRH